MMTGRIDALLASGYVLGWALDEANPFCAVEVLLCSASKELASGLANLFRQDLVDAKVGCGWHHFKLRVSYQPLDLRREYLELRYKASGCVLHSIRGLPFTNDLNENRYSLDDMLKGDPLSARGIIELRQCKDRLNQFVIEKGVSEFVRTSYLYVLGRPVDDVGLQNYTLSIRRNLMSAYELLEVLASSDEFATNNRVLPSPMTAGFLFR